MKVNKEICRRGPLPHLPKNLQSILASFALNEETNTYCVVGREGRLYLVSQLISTCIQPFNAALMAQRGVTSAKWPNPIHFVKMSKRANPAKELAEIWNRENSRKANFGLFHKCM
ncbi:hypothetical protein PR048_013179 [Dryococelus australis]|uniref:Uncharacterized protein n=1 Tax=Dryococelus australis TaxID=614101 RepID=A0ABQ9HRF2_9NEOP|nr:hypothetical protein PR048_013179 [Dryococelus australis]